ncbi:MAG: sugar phosphate isomerase/epimerase [candidate division WS1 bacterium]|jgi:sugar phosphate isomerase/epimerase|nr:sugar phosphate isomerase/epimerase [candidate division WS1 bacterium]
MSDGIRYAVFSKPWKTLPLPDLARHISGLGFTGVELPVRPEFQVEPERVTEGLPEAARIFGDHGVSIESIAGPTDEAAIAACAEAGVPIIRICLPIGDDGYLASEARYKREFEELAPTLEQYGVAVGIQNHCNNQVGSCLGVRNIIGDFSPDQFCIVWDPAHNVLAGEIPEQAIDISWSHLRMVNLKSPWWMRANSLEAAQADWKLMWTTGRHGIAPWPRVVAALKARNWQGPVCFTAEYSDHSVLDSAAVDDLLYAQMLFGE